MKEELEGAAAQLRIDASDEWGVRRKHNMRAAAKVLDQAVTEIDELKATIEAQALRIDELGGRLG